MNQTKRKAKPQLHRCGDCANCVPVTDFHTLTVHGKRPTLGTCPYWKGSRCVLLSWKSDCKHFKPKKV